MKKVYQAVIAIGIIWGLSSCAAPQLMVHSLTGSYQEAPTVISSSRSFDKVWDTTIDYFAQKGISISTIDRSSGLLIARKRFASDNWSYEEAGRPKNPIAFVVVSSCGYMVGYSSQDFHPDYIEGEWNVRIKQEGDRTLINVNLYNLVVQGKPNIINGAQYANPCLYQAKSTGVFEKGLAQVFAGE